MPETIEVLVTEFRADIKRYEASLRRQARATDTAAAKIEKRFQTMNNRLASGTALSTRKVVAALGTISIAAAFRGSTRVLADFGQAMSTVAAITRATGSDFQALEDKARNLGATTRFSATQAAEGMVFLARAGFSTDEVLGSIEGTLQLAQAGALDLGRAADIASNVLSGFRLNVSDTGRVVDVLALAANSANTDVSQLGEALKFVAPVAAGLGVPIEEATAAIGKLSDNGLQASLAGTGLRRILSELESPASKSAGIISGLGLTLDQVRPSSVGLTAALDALAGAGIDTGQALELFGDRGGPAFEVLSNNIPAVKAMTAALSEADGTAARIATTMDQNLNGALLATGSRLQELILSLGDAGATDALIGVLEGLQKLLTFAAENADNFTKGLIIAAAAAAGFAGAKALGALVVILPRLGAQLVAANAIAATSTLSLNTLTVATRAFFVALGPVGLIAIAAGALAAFALNADGARQVSSEYAMEIDGLTSSIETYRNAALLANEATGEAKVAAEEDAKLKREQAAATLESAKAKIVEARATIAQLEAQNRAAAKGNSFVGVRIGNLDRAGELRRDINALSASIREAEQILANPVAPVAVAGENDNKPGSGKPAAADEIDADTARQIAALEKLTQTEADQINILKEQRLAAIAASGRSEEEQSKLRQLAEQEAFEAFAELNTERARLFDERAAKYGEEADAAREAATEELALMTEIEAATARLHGRAIEATRLEFEAERIRLEARLAGLDEVERRQAELGLIELEGLEQEFNQGATREIDGLTGGRGQEEDTLSDRLALIDEQEAKKLELLASYRDTELEQLRDFEAIKSEIEAEADQQRLEARKASFDANQQALSASAGRVLSLITRAAGEGGRAARAAAKIEAGIAIGRTVVSGAQAAASSFANAGGFPFGIPAAAASLAFTGLQVATIASQSFATGGLVTGRGTGTSDDVPINASNGEFVTTAAATGRNLSGLKRLNAGMSPAEAFGLQALAVPSAPGAGVISGANQVSGPISIGGPSLNVSGDITPDVLPDIMARLDSMQKNFTNNVTKVITNRDRTTMSRQRRQVGS